MLFCLPDFYHTVAKVCKDAGLKMNQALPFVRLHLSVEDKPEGSFEIIDWAKQKNSVIIRKSKYVHFHVRERIFKRCVKFSRLFGSVQWHRWTAAIST